MPRPRLPVVLLGVALALPLAIALALPYVPAGRVVAPAPSAVRTSFPPRPSL